MDTVLYLEDTSDQRDLVAMVLSSVGIQIEVAGDGQEGLKKIALGRPGLILLDLGMPKLDGFEFMAILKGQEETRDIPIIVISAWTSAFYREKAIESGAIEFLSKPYDIDELIAVVQRNLPH